MNGVAVLIPVALSLGLLGLAAFFWAARGGQFEDLDGAAMRILIEEDRPGAPTAPMPTAPATRPRSIAD